MYEWFKDLYDEVESDINYHTKEGNYASELIVLQNMLIYDLCKINDHYHLSDINIDDYIAIKYAIKDVIRKISWSLYHDNYREMKWLDEFHKSYKESIENIKRIERG